VILEELKAVTSHPTAAEIHKMIKPKMPRVSLGTVYRNLDFLSNNGIIQKIETTGRKMRFDGNAQPHIHVRCIECGKLEDIPNISIRSIQDKVSNISSFKIVGHNIGFEGLCPDCSKQH
jgi:Fur family ferric uptake transcriptional regulator